VKYLLAISICSALAAGQGAAAQSRPQAIVGATLIDVAHFGRTQADIDNAVVVIRNGHIEAVGAAAQVRIPKDARIVHARGQFMIPGLIDGFGSLRSAGFAHAYLHAGVTTVYVQLAPDGQDGEQRLVRAALEPDVRTGVTLSGYSPDGALPAVHPWTEHRLHDRRLSAEELGRAVDAAATAGHRGILVSLDVWPEQLDTVLMAARRRQLIVAAEPAFTSYPYAIRAGASVLIRNDRYQSGLATPQNWLSYSEDPAGVGVRPAFRDVCETNPAGAEVAAYGGQLAQGTTALMPMLSIEATADDLDTPNPWSSPSAVFVQPTELDDPVDPRTGARPYLEAHPTRRAELQRCAWHREELDRALHAAGAIYLAASAAPAFGIMPGWGLHEELALLQRIGLTPREALAAATSNYADLFGWSDIGRIEPGRTANLVFLSRDPRQDISAVDAISAVWLRGVAVDRRGLLPRRTHS